MKPLTDDLLLNGIGHMLDQHEAIPADALDAALAAFDMGQLDDELAQLCFDSLHDEPALALRHGGVADRTMTFTSSVFGVDIELLADGRTLVGHVEASQVTRIDVETPRSRQAYETDDLGRFNLQIGAGPFRLYITDGCSTVCTPWITR